MSSYPYVFSAGIPLLLIFCGAFTRKLVRGSHWQASDFYFGVELTLSAIATALVYLYELARAYSIQPAPSGALPERMVPVIIFIATCFFLLLTVLSVHQDWEFSSSDQRRQFIWLGIFSNLVGVGLFMSFVLFVNRL